LWLVVGLGNPGTKYRDTRHNAGFRVIDHLGEQHSIAVDTPLYLALTGRGVVLDHPVVLAKPTTYMNRSGLSVAAAARGLGVEPERMIVVHDDIDLEEGQLRVRFDGGSGGHRGVESIIWALGTRGFYRVRVGVGRPPQGWDAAEYVLEPLRERLLDDLDALCRRAAQATESILLHGIEEAMRRFNGKGSKELPVATC